MVHSCVVERGLVSQQDFVVCNEGGQDDEMDENDDDDDDDER
jgi:hypothetical protein